MTILARIGLIVSVLFLSACAINQARGPIYPEPASPAAGQSHLVVYRPLGESGGYERVHALTIDAERRANMLHGGFSVLEVAPGTYKLETAPRFTILAWLPCIMVISVPLVLYAELIAETGTELTIDVGSGETKFIRFSPPDLALEAVSSSDARRELKECREQD